VTSLFAIIQRFNLGVRTACAMMPAATNNPAALYQNCADERIGRSRAEPAPGQAKGQAHVIRISKHKENPKPETRRPKEIRNPKAEI
jgi:hypothetical protein